MEFSIIYNDYEGDVTLRIAAEGHCELGTAERIT